MAFLWVALAVVAVELVLRALRLAPVAAVATVSQEQYERVPGIFAPNQTLVDRRKPTLPHRVTIGNLGFRGQDVPRERPTGEFRIVVAGDSFTYGDFVDDGETLPAQLESALKARGTNVRVINAGLGGSTITDETHMIERALSLAPDLVIVVFAEEDYSRLGTDTPMWTRLAANRGAKSRFPLSVLYPLLRRTALWNLGLRISATRQTADVPSWRDWEPYRERYRDALLALRDSLREWNVPLVLVAYPCHWTVSGETSERIDWALAQAQAAGVPTVTLLPPLRASGEPTTKLYLLPQDGHPSPVAYAIVAQHLAESLLQLEPLATRAT